MYRVLIVDDEFLSRFVLRTIITNKINNVEVVGEAENGRQAIEKNSLLKPDIIIMDIKMPGINGIEATREIITYSPGVSVLILTAYDNFDYVKTVLDFGVKGYILKPVKEEEVVEKIAKITKDLEEKSNRLGLEEQIENKIKIIKPLIESELISSFISGNFEIEKAESYLKFLEIDIQSGYFMLITTEQSSCSDLNEAIRYRILRDKIYDVATKHIPLFRKCFFGNSIGNTLVVFFPLTSEELKNDVSKEAVIIGEEIKSRIKIITKVNVAVGIGNSVTGINELSRSYNGANYALKKSLKEGKVVLYGNIAEVENFQVENIYPIELENHFIEQIKIGNIYKAKQLCGEIITSIFSRNTSLEVLKECITELLTVLKRTASKIGIPLNSIGASIRISELTSLKDVSELNFWCKRNIFNILDIIENKSGKNREIIDMTFEYINKCFTKDITLELVAGEVGISPQYLSKIFKEKYGSNFIDYITAKRLELSRELLEKKNTIDIKEISSAVGYADPYYFCKIFKKHIGFTPKQYRVFKITGEN